MIQQHLQQQQRRIDLRASTSRHGILWGSGYGSKSATKTVVTTNLLRQNLMFQHVLIPHQYLDTVTLKPFYIQEGISHWGWCPSTDWKH